MLVNGRRQKRHDWVMLDEKTAARWLQNNIVDNGVSWDESAGKKHVLMVSKHCCTRVTKQAAALKLAGWRVDSLSCSMPAVLDGFEVLRVAREAEFEALIKESAASIIHVHNEPDRLMYYADAGANGRPIVYDCHDLEFYRTFSVGKDELFAFQRADGIINVGKEHRDFAYSKHPWGVPEAITMSAPLRAWRPASASETARRKGVIYEGGSTPGASNANRFRDHTQVERAFAAAEMRMTLFVPTQALTAYENARMMLPYKVLLQEITNYQWGFIGSDIRTDKGDVCLPNKTFDYLLGGTPLACCNVPGVERFMEGRAGVYAKTMDKLIEKMKRADWYTLQAEALEAARFMEDEIKNTLMVYDALLGTHECSVCGKTGFKNVSGLHGHMRSKHPDEYAALEDAAS